MTSKETGKVDNVETGDLENVEGREKRQRTLSEKGKQLEYDKCVRNFHHLRKEIKTLVKVIHECVDSNDVKESRAKKTELTELLSKIHETHDRVVDLADGVEENFAEMMNEIDVETVKISEDLRRLENSEVASRKSSKSKSSRTRSKRTVLSRSSSTIEKLVDAEVEYREKELEERYVEDTIGMERRHRQIENQRLAIEDERRKMKSKLEKEKSRVKLETYRKYCEEQDLGSDDDVDVVRKIDSTPLNVDVPSFVPNFQRDIAENLISRTAAFRESNSAESSRDNENQNQRSEAAENVVMTQRETDVDVSNSGGVVENPGNGDDRLLELLLEQNAPEADLKVYDGDPLEFRMFMRTFEAEVESKVKSNMSRLNRLMKFTSGMAHEIVLPKIYEADGYLRAKEELEKEFSSERKISASYNQQLRDWPAVKPNDAKSIQMYYLFLNKVQYCLESTEFQHELNTQDNLRKCVRKLPYYIQEKWNRKATHISEVDGRKPKFSDLLNFISMEHKIASNPTFSRQAMSERNNSESSGTHGNSKRYNDQARNQGYRIKSVATRQVTPNCERCHKDNHSLNQCYKFREDDMKSRHQLIRDKNLCFGCLKRTGPGHVSKNCRQKLKCTICQGLHPTCLHENREKVRAKETTHPKAETKTDKEGKETTETGINEVKSYATGLESGQKVALSCVLAEVVNEETGLSAKCYCFLDSLSNGSFISESLRDSLFAEKSDKTREYIQLNTLSGEERKKLGTVNGLRIRNVMNNEERKLPKLYVIPELPVDRGDIMTNREMARWPHLREIMDEIPKYDPRIPVGLIIGNDAPRLLEPYDVVRSEDNDQSPYAVKYMLGWTCAGPMASIRSIRKKACSTRIVTETGATLCRDDMTNKEADMKTLFEKMYLEDFIEKTGSPRSQEDHDFMHLLETETRFVDGQYELPLPFRAKEPKPPDNREKALKSAMSVKNRLDRGPAEEKKRFYDFMRNMENKGYSSKVSAEQLKLGPGDRFYVTYHGVKNPKKPEKTRVVFHCAKQFKYKEKPESVALNDLLMIGPAADLCNSQVGVEMRWREEPAAFIADLEDFFYKNRVPINQRTYLRYFWFDEVTGEPVEMHMNVHLFGACSSPAVCNFALKKCAEDNAEKFPTEISKTVQNNFYVDDLCKSCESTEEAKQVASQVRKLCDMGGYKLTKFVASDPAILEDIPGSDIAVKGPEVRVLGTKWNTENDRIGFEMPISMRTVRTKRQLLSDLSTLSYDPCGLLSPCFLEGKRIMQLVTAMKVGWDVPIDQSVIERYERWRESLDHLRAITLPRCYKPKDFGRTVRAELHTYSDASEYGYGCAVYVRMENEAGEVSTALVAGKSRVLPIAGETIPRAELEAARLGARLTDMVAKELTYPIEEKFCYTDSMIVLSYLKNTTRKFKTFVSNRVREIKMLVDVENWKYVVSEENPADDASRGLEPAKLNENHRWFTGPEPLKQRSEDRSEMSELEIPEVDENDKEVKKDQRRSNAKFEKSTSAVIDEKIKNVATKTKDGNENHHITGMEEEERKTKSTDKIDESESDVPISRMIEKLSDWYKIKYRIASVIALVENCRHKKKEDIIVTVELLQRAETKILQYIQRRAFGQEIEIMKRNSKKASDSSDHKHEQLPKNSPLRKLDPYLDHNDIIRVGGRLRNTEIEESLRNPIILPKTSTTVDALLQDCHESVCHGGRGFTMNEVRSRGYHVIHLNGKVRRLIHKCIKCRKLRGEVGEQKMADLPSDRAEKTPPMTYCAVDMFGPYVVRIGRKDHKRYVALFTDMVFRGIHLEACESLDTDSFLNAIARFTNRRGNIRLLRSDNGGNFVGSNNEIRKAMEEMEPKVREELLKKGCDFEWRFNTPTASNHGGVFERQIGTVRRILDSILKANPGQLSDEAFRTLLSTAEGIVNCRPLSVESLNDPESLLPLSPMNLLTQKSRVVLPPLGRFDDRGDLYSRKQWRRVQHLSEEFWSRFKHEYLTQLNERTKWQKECRNLREGDIVIVKDDSMHRNDWPLGKVVNVFPDKSGLVRSVKIRMARSDLKHKPTEIERPINKLVLMLESEV